MSDDELREHHDPRPFTLTLADIARAAIFRGVEGDVVLYTPDVLLPTLAEKAINGHDPDANEPYWFKP